MHVMTHHIRCACACVMRVRPPLAELGERGRGVLPRRSIFSHQYSFRTCPSLFTMFLNTYTNVDEHLQHLAMIIMLVFSKMLLSCTLDVQASHVMLQMSSALHCGGKVVAGICLPAGFTALTASYCILEHAQASEIANGAMICEILLHPTC